MRLFPIAVILLLAWGALAMGGSPSWAGAPVAVFAVTTGILGFLERRDASPTRVLPRLPHRLVIVALLLFLTAVGVQLVSLPASVVTSLSPSRDIAEFEKLLATADRRDPESVPAVAADAPRPLSIAPARTWWGLGFAAGLAVYLVGASKGLSAVGVSGITRMAIGLGVVVAFLGMYQFTSGTSTLYGWYVPMLKAQTGPFINRNHQAGWLVMVLALTLGLFSGDVARGMRGVIPSWRDRLIWFSTAAASFSVLLLFAAVIMAIGILTTTSRSGAIALVLALATIALLSGRRQSSSARRGVAFASLVAVGLIAVFTSGSAVISRFAGFSVQTDGRFAAWRDSLRILRDFPITGTGFNTYGASMVHYQTALINGERLVEAHNDYLQLATEGGWLLGIPALLLILSLAIEIRRRFQEQNDDTRTYSVRVGALAGIVAMAFQSSVDFTLQMPGAAVMFATLLAVAIHHPRPRAASSQRHVD